MKRPRTRRQSASNQFRYNKPYRFEKLTSGRGEHVYLPLNRNYKPLGYTSHERVRYEDYEADAVVFRCDPHQIEGAWSNAETLYLYNDSPDSRRGYFERLEKILSHKVAVVASSEESNSRLR